MIIHPPNDAIDDELLSAYLDGQLLPQDQRRVEAALAGDAALASSLATLRYTKTLLAAAPRIPAPRPFTLNEAMIGRSQPRRGWLAWLQPASLRAMAAMAAVMLLVLVVGDMGVRTQIIPSQQTAQVQPELGGLTPDQGDPTAIIAKTSTTAATPGFLGLPPATLLALQVGLAVLVALLLAAAWQMSRAP
ncbi:MAG TPA: zf-HC2 domain-containing protein [Anaerolineae bacterium]|nr:zf-HC2 domain-containing protein [Anaerolineae bacterium]